MSKQTRAVVLISGSGSNLQAFIDQVSKGELPIEISSVRPGINTRDRRGATRYCYSGWFYENFNRRLRQPLS